MTQAMQQKYSILIVDDHPIFRKGLRYLIDTQKGYAVAGEAENCTQAMDLLKEKKPDIVLLDLSLGLENGLDLIKGMKAAEPSVLILVLSMHNEKYYAERALLAGAKGYIMKQEADQMVIEALQTVVAGKIWLSAAARERILERMVGNAAEPVRERFATVHKLSNREFEIFSLIGRGFGTVEIASMLNLKTKTIDTHKEHIKRKLHCATSNEMRHLAVEWYTNQT